MASTAHLAFVLHAHLPYVRHPEHEVFLEEDWLFEAITDCYIPLLECFERLRRENIDVGVTFSLSCTLAAMLSDDLLRRRYDRYLNERRALLSRERTRIRGDARLERVVSHYCERLDVVERRWQDFGGDLIRPLVDLQEQGTIELITSAATHGYLPLMMRGKVEAAWAQIKVAVDEHAHRLGVAPKGMWLPECGFAPQVDALVARAGIRYFVLDTHALLLARPRPRYGAHAPIFCPDSGVAAFGRDDESAEQVWSRERGYPGHAAYRDFYRDIGFELPAAALGRSLQPDGGRRFTGIKYHSISDKGEHREFYDPDRAAQVAIDHAKDFVRKRVAQLSRLRTVVPHAIVTAPYDAELFGHWWYEGAVWFEHVLREAARQPPGALQRVRLGEYLQRQPTHQLAQPAESSWGEGGYHQYWLDGSNAWIYPRLDRAAERMVELAREHDHPDSLLKRALDQAARELLLAQASDWAFIMRSNTSVEYAKKRTELHLSCFERLSEQIGQKAVDPSWLDQLEESDNLFPTTDYRVYAERPI